MRLSSRRAVPAALFAATLFVAGCGDDDVDDIIPPLDEDVQDTTGVDITPDDEDSGTTDGTGNDE
jgi:hypothetical protein